MPYIDRPSVIECATVNVVTCSRIGRIAHSAGTGRARTGCDRGPWAGCACSRARGIRARSRAASAARNWPERSIVPLQFEPSIHSRLTSHRRGESSADTDRSPGRRASASASRRRGIAPRAGTWRAHCRGSAGGGRYSTLGRPDFVAVDEQDDAIDEDRSELAQTRVALGARDLRRRPCHRQTTRAAAAASRDRWRRRARTTRRRSKRERDLRRSVVRVVGLHGGAEPSRARARSPSERPGLWPCATLAGRHTHRGIIRPLLTAADLRRRAWRRCSPGAAQPRRSRSSRRRVPAGTRRQHLDAGGRHRSGAEHGQRTGREGD